MRKDIIKRAIEVFKEHFRKKDLHPYLSEYRYDLPVHTVVEITSWYEIADEKGGDNIVIFPVPEPKPEVKPDPKPEEKQ